MVRASKRCRGLAGGGGDAGNYADWHRIGWRPKNFAGIPGPGNVEVRVAKQTLYSHYSAVKIGARPYNISAPIVADYCRRRETVRQTVLSSMDRAAPWWEEADHANAG